MHPSRAASLAVTAKLDQTRAQFRERVRRITTAVSMGKGCRWSPAQFVAYLGRLTPEEVRQDDSLIKFLIDAAMLSVSEAAHEILTEAT